MQISVGTDAVWAVTHDGGVWFRKGIKGEMSGVCEQLASGTGWVEMLSKMALVSVAPNDQVISNLNSHDRSTLCIRYSDVDLHFERKKRRESEEIMGFSGTEICQQMQNLGYIACCN